MGIFSLGGKAVSWNSSKQTCIDRSIMESKFILLDKASEEDEWPQNFVEDISFQPKTLTPIYIHCDSKFAIGKVGSMMCNGKFHHIIWRHTTIRELLSGEIIMTEYVKSKGNMPDPLIKDLPREGVERSLKEMGLGPWISYQYSNSIQKTEDPKSQAQRYQTKF